MGVCTGRNRTKEHKFTLPKLLQSKFHHIECELLHMIYMDLSSRCVDGLINRTSFTDFFTMIGLWSSLVFDYFNQEMSELINFEQFVKGVEYFIKCDEEQKIEHLFRLYDLHQVGSIKKEEFLQMIQNYPREDIISLLDDQTFLQEEHILEYHKKKQKINRKARPLKADEQDFSESLQYVEKRRRSASQSYHESQSSDNLGPYKEESVNMMFPNPSMVGVNGVPVGQSGQCLTFNVNGKVVELKRVNVNYLVQKYVDMIYKGKPQDQNEISIDEFKNFVRKHPKVFHGLYKAFNYDIWGIDEESQVPRMSLIQKDLEGVVYKASKKNPQTKKERIFRLIQHFCLSFKSNTSGLPSRIICLDGLMIQELVDQQTQTYGFEISHKDKIYQTRVYYCTSYEDFKKWTNNLQIFQKAQVNEYYSILQKIGEGKFSIVYQCQSKQTKEILAIKIIEKFKLSKSEKFMLAHEVEIMKLLNHSCIIKFKEIVETKTHLNIITELVKDGDLFDYITKNELICEQEASLIMGQLLDTVHYIHTVGIVHRDLKPENIMIVYDESKSVVKQVKLIDFGFANYLVNIQSKEEALCGTTNYLAPETLEQKQITFKVDNFALGVILFFLLSGYLPFDSEFPEDIIKNIIDCKYDIDDEFWHQISENARDLIKRLLTKEPNERISTSEALKHPWIINRDQLPTNKAIRQKRLVLF